MKVGDRETFGVGSQERIIKKDGIMEARIIIEGTELHKNVEYGIFDGKDRLIEGLKLTNTNLYIGTFDDEVFDTGCKWSSGGAKWYASL